MVYLLLRVFTELGSGAIWVVIFLVVFYTAVIAVVVRHIGTVLKALLEERDPGRASGTTGQIWPWWLLFSQVYRTARLLTYVRSARLGTRSNKTSQHSRPPERILDRAGDRLSALQVSSRHRPGDSYQRTRPHARVIDRAADRLSTLRVSSRHPCAVPKPRTWPDLLVYARRSYSFASSTCSLSGCSAGWRSWRAATQPRTGNLGAPP